MLLNQTTTENIEIGVRESVKEGIYSLEDFFPPLIESH